jgi:peptidyl-prolyl cis-trans isomerase SurA
MRARSSLLVATSTLVALALPLVALAPAACSGGSDAAAPTAPTTPAEPAVQPAPEPAPVEPAATELCASVIVVAWAGAEHAAPTITRTEDQARARAEELLARIERGEDFATIARAESDAASSGPRGGLLGTYPIADWPAAHGAIREPIAALGIGQTSQVLEAPYGFVIARRCPIEHIHTRHILIRYAGARNASEEITRTRAQARELADRIFNQLQDPTADFAALAREHSEDGSAERGGDVGISGRGRLAEAYEQAAYALPVGGIAPVVETDFGFHVIQRIAE